MNKLFHGKVGKELEIIGADIFESIGLNCFHDLGQTKLNKIVSGYPPDAHLEFDYLIPEDKVCLIGEITSRTSREKTKQKYEKFIQYVNIIKNLDFSDSLWRELGIKEENLRNFKDIELIKGFFIVTTQEKYDVNLQSIEDMVVFYQSDFSRLYEYSQSMGKWTKNYFLRNFCIESANTQALTVYEKDNSLIRLSKRKISSKDTVFSDLYTFTISPYELLSITHVYRQDELPSLQASIYNYQRPLDYEKLKTIRKKLLNNQDFIFPSNILVILSRECNSTKDGQGNEYLHIPKKYGSLSVIDGQHRLFSYADEKVQSIMKDDCKILVTAVKFQTSDEQLLNKLSANIFIEININQTRVEIGHIDKIAYELGSDNAKVIATKIIATLNTRINYSQFFDITSDKLNKGIIDAGTIIDQIKKITNIDNIVKLKNPRSDKNITKKNGLERLFDASISELSDRDKLVEKGVIFLERYFNTVFSVFRHDKPKKKKEPHTSFLFSKFWGGWINLLIIFLEEDLNWDSIRNELNEIRDNVKELRQVAEYKTVLFNPEDRNIPDSKHNPKKVGNFLNENRKQATSIQKIS